MLSTFGDAGAIDSPAVDNTRAVTAEPAAPDAERARLEGAVAGKYRIDALIGRGLFSTVFRATEIRGAAEVAIKLLDAGVRTTPEILEHIEAGQRACAALGDVGVVAASSVEQHESATFLVMSLMHGGSLTEVLRSRGPLPLREVVDIVREVAATLDRLHAAGITHRGLTPGSILFDFSGRPCIADIGVTDSLLAAGALDASLTPPARAYAAPEQWRTQTIGGRADQYALALIAHEMLTGEPPRHRETVDGYRVLEPLGILPDEPLRKGVPIYVNAALRKALSAAISSRFGTATAFAEALAGRSVRERQSLSAPPPPEVHVSQKGRIAAAIGALVLVLAIAAVVSSGLISRVRSTWRATIASSAQSPKKIELPSSPPTLVLSPALALPPATATERPVAPPVTKTTSSTVRNVVEVPVSGSRTRPAGTATRQRSSPTAAPSVAVVSAGTVVDAPRRAAAKDSASGAASPVVPGVASGTLSADAQPRERKSWFARLFSSEPPQVVLPLNAYIHVAADRGVPTVTIDGIDRGIAPVTALVNAGHHTVAVDGPVTYTFTSTGVVVGRRDTARVMFHASKTP